MKNKVLLIAFLIFSYFFSLADYPNSKEVWISLHTLLKNPTNQLELIKIRNICIECKIKDSTYVQIPQKIAENYVSEQDYINGNIFILLYTTKN